MEDDNSSAVSGADPRKRRSHQENTSQGGLSRSRIEYSQSGLNQPSPFANPQPVVPGCRAWSHPLPVLFGKRATFQGPGHFPSAIQLNIAPNIDDNCPAQGKQVEGDVPKKPLYWHLRSRALPIITRHFSRIAPRWIGP